MLKEEYEQLFLELKDAMLVSVNFIDDGQIKQLINIKPNNDEYEFMVKFSNFNYIKILIHFKDKRIKINTNVNSTNYDESYIRERFQKICAEPKRINSWGFNKDITYDILHNFKISEKNLQRTYKIFLLSLELIENRK